MSVRQGHRLASTPTSLRHLGAHGCDESVPLAHGLSSSVPRACGRKASCSGRTDTTMCPSVALILWRVDAVSFLYLAWGVNFFF